MIRGSCVALDYCFCFFSSRRRHTRYWRDWSSDVCSSDLVVARWPDIFHAPRFSESPLLPAVILCFGLAAFAAQIGLAAIIGAFLAGMVCAEMKDRHDFEEEVAPLYAFFPPFFFVFIGLEVDLAAFGDIEVLLGLLGITALAAATKFVPAWLAARRLGRRDAIVVGIGMVPRGEVGIIVAGIGATAGVVEPRLFAVNAGTLILLLPLIPPLLPPALVLGRLLFPCVGNGFALLPQKTGPGIVS